MKEQDFLYLAALLHDIGKFRRRATSDNDKPHQEHSHEFITQDFGEFFAPCGDTFKNAIRHHHHEPTQLQHIIEKQVILADRLSAVESGDEETTAPALVSILSQLKGADKDKKYRYLLTELNFEKQGTVIPSESADVNQSDYADLWRAFTGTLREATTGKHYTSSFYQTLVALLHKYTSRMPSEAANTAESDISLYDHLRTTAAIAACIGRELTDEADVDALLTNPNDSDRNISALIKGDISGIQSFLYHILSDGAARQLRGRSFYLQLLTEAIAHWVLRQLDIPITNLLLASGGHFYILAPYTDTKDRFDAIRKQISEKLWALHNGELCCILDYADVNAGDFAAKNFANKWGEVSEKVHHRKQQKWSELGKDAMFQNFFEPQRDKEIWDFSEFGQELRRAKYLVAFEVPESDIPERPTWQDAMKAFGLDIHIYAETDGNPSEPPPKAEKAIVYRLEDTDFLSDIEKYQWEGLPASYDFRIFRPVIAYIDEERIADYNAIAEASEGVNWLGALRMDVDNLGTVFTEKLENATISRLATLSESMRLFFEGYVPELCYQHNKNQAQILELIYAGGDDLFLVGGWSALPEIAEEIRTKFRDFVTGDHVTLSGGIAIEHMKFPLYQFADLSGDAEDDAKSLRSVNAEGAVIEKDAITFLRKPMSWTEFAEVREWHQKFLDAVRADRQPLPSVFLTRLNQIYADKRRWAWRSLYYFSRIQERYNAQTSFLRELQRELNHPTTLKLREFIHVITRWTALRIRK